MYSRSKKSQGMHTTLTENQKIMDHDDQSDLYIEVNTSMMPTAIKIALL